MKVKILLFVFFLAGFGINTFSQVNVEEADTVFVKKTPHSPMRATLYSAVLPGMGQIYNKQYYKVPIIYAGLATMTYLAMYNADQYIAYRNGYADFIKEDGGNKSYENLEAYNPLYLNNRERLEYIKNAYRRSRDLSIIGFVGIYALNIIEANVAAHFLNYDIGEDLVLKVQPTINAANSMRLATNIKPVYGVTLNLQLN